MRRAAGLWAIAVAVVGMMNGSAQACHRCKVTPCRYVPAPAGRCVTEMVPYTVMQPRTRCEMVPVTRTITVQEPFVTYTSRQREVCRPKIETSYVTVKSVVCKPVVETSSVTQTFTVCKPVSTTETVMQTSYRPITECVSVPVKSQCGQGLLCGKHVGLPCGGVTTGCQTVQQTRYVPVCVPTQVVRTTLVPEVQTRQVPVTTCRYVPEERVEQRPVTRCTMVREVITEQVPNFGVRCVTKEVTQMVPKKVCEIVPVTCYRPVTRWVPCEPAPVPVAPTAQTTPTAQAAPSGQL